MSDPSGTPDPKKAKMEAEEDGPDAQVTVQFQSETGKENWSWARAGERVELQRGEIVKEVMKNDIIA